MLILFLTHNCVHLETDPYNSVGFVYVMAEVTSLLRHLSIVAHQHVGTAFGANLLDADALAQLVELAEDPMKFCEGSRRLDLA